MKTSDLALIGFWDGSNVGTMRRPTDAELSADRQQKQTGIDQGNNGSISCGLHSFTRHDGERVHVGQTFTQSKEFKTETGAISWLHRRGLDINGDRIERVK